MKNKVSKIDPRETPAFTFVHDEDWLFKTLFGDFSKSPLKEITVFFYNFLF